MIQERRRPLARLQSLTMDLRRFPGLLGGTVVIDAVLAVLWKLVHRPPYPRFASPLASQQRSVLVDSSGVRYTFSGSFWRWKTTSSAVMHSTMILWSPFVLFEPFFLCLFSLPRSVSTFCCTTVSASSPNDSSEAPFSRAAKAASILRSMGPGLLFRHLVEQYLTSVLPCFLSISYDSPAAVAVRNRVTHCKV